MTHPRHIVGTVATSALLLMAVAACSQESPQIESKSGSAMGHIHGLGVDPSDGTLYAASHLGLFRVENGAPRRVGEAWHDLMGFLVIGPSHFVASGHPDLASDLPKHLGLIESIDAGVTWTPASLAGQADFHALDGTETFLVGYNGVSSRLLVTRDRKSWTTVDQRPIVDVASAPGSRDYLATTPTGELLRYTGARESRARTVVAPPLAFIEWAPEDLVVGLSAAGEVHVSRDAGQSWTKKGSLPGAPEALTVTSAGWYAAAEGAIFVSTDAGDTWSRLA